MNELTSELHPTWIVTKTTWGHLSDLGWDQTRFSPSNVRFLEAPHNMTLRCLCPSATWPIYDSIIRIKHYIYYIFKYDRNTDRNIIINLCWKNIELYKLTMDQQTLKTPLLVLVVLLPVLQGLVLVQVQLVTALPLPAASPKCACLGRRIWMPVYDPYKPDIHLLTVSGCMCGNAGAGGNLSKQHLYTTGNER